MDIGFGKNVHERNLGRILREECDVRRGAGRPPWGFFGSKVAAADYCCYECPAHFYPDGEFVLYGQSEQGGRIDLEIRKRGWNGTGNSRFISFGRHLE